MKIESLLAMFSTAVSIATFIYTTRKTRASRLQNIRVMNAGLKSEEAMQVTEETLALMKPQNIDEVYQLHVEQKAKDWLKDFIWEWDFGALTGTYKLTIKLEQPEDIGAIDLLRKNRKSLHLISITIVSANSAIVCGWNHFGYQQKIGTPGEQLTLLYLT